MDDKQDVKLYIYDVSKGLARSLSPVLLGETESVVCYLYCFATVVYCVVRLIEFSVQTSHHLQ